MNTILSVTNVTKRFGPRTIIHNLSFTIEQGNRVTIFAPSGSGKTTLINILSNLDKNFEGTFRLHARNPSTIFQEPRLFSYMTVRENLFFPLHVQKIPMTSRMIEHYEQWLDICDLRDHLQHYPYQISGGMKQKVSLIRSFMTDPDFVMMDEPFKSIDIASKNRMIRHIIQSYPSTTILLVTHNLDEIPLLTKSLMLFKKTVLTEFREYSDVSVSQVSDLFAQIFKELSS